jgi:hypothetical protein
MFSQGQDVKTFYTNLSRTARISHDSSVEAETHEDKEHMKDYDGQDLINIRG